MNAEQSVIRRRRTQAEIQQLVREFLSSGMKEFEFCRSRGLSWDTLDRHLKKQGHRATNRLVRVKIADKKSLGPGEQAKLVVVLGQGRKIEVASGFDGETLEQVVKVLEGV